MDELAYVLGAGALGLILVALGLYALIRRLEHIELYASFVRLRTLQKLKFFHLLIVDPRIPRRVKALPFLLAGYLAFPIDLIPGFILVLGYLDDIAIIVATLALVIRLTPREVIEELLRQVARPDQAEPPGCLDAQKP